MRASRLVVVPRTDDAVTVWVYDVRLDAPGAEVERCVGVLSAEERVRAGAYRFARDRERFLVGRASLRRILAEHGAGDPARLVLGTGAFGKPRLKARSPLRFNVSHTGDRALVAVAERVEVGIDLEQVRPFRQVLSVARLVCTDTELAVLSALPPDRRHLALLRCWVRKEACAKIVGLGLRQGLAAFGVGVQGAVRSEATTVALPGASGVVLVDLPVDGGHVAALGIETA